MASSADRPAQPRPHAVPGRSPPPPLVGRGRELAQLIERLVAAGKSNAQIADELVISVNTVQRHVGNILNKTGLTNRTRAASYAHRVGIVRMAPSSS